MLPSPRSADARVLTAVTLSLVVHVAVLGNWRVHALTRPELGVFKPIEVALVNEVVPRPVKRAQSPPRAASARPAAAQANEPPARTPIEELTQVAKAQPPVIEARSDVASLKNPKPPYPLAARRGHMQGLVLVSVFVRSDGMPGDVKLKQSSGHAMLDSAALDTVRRWRFVPAYRGDTPMDSEVDVPIRFRLEK